MHGSSGSEALASHLLHLSVLQLVTRSSPFTHSRTLPLHTLSELVADYLSLLALSAKDSAELAGRDHVSVWDVGKALEEFGLGDINEMREEMENSKFNGGNAIIEGGEVVEDQGEKIRELAGGLRELMEPQPEAEAILRLSYVPLTDYEIATLVTNPEAVYDEADGDSSSEESDSELRSITPSSPPLFIKEEDGFINGYGDQMMGVEEIGTSAWRDPNQIPFYVNEFLPPFPGMEKEKVVPEPSRRKREKERERDAAAEAWAGSSNSSDPWITTIPLASSSYAGQSTSSLLQPLSPPGSPSTRHNRRRPRSLSPPAASSSSLAFYNSVSREIRHVPLWPRPNPKRREAASKISVSTDMTLSIDSLFASIPVPPTRSAGLTSGFLPDSAPSRIHPFNTSLPHTIAGPALVHPAPNAPVLAPLPHPRIPNIIGSIATPYSLPTSPHLQLFTRLTRIGPPGPLGTKGEALEYEYVAGTGVVASNVEWPQRLHNLKLPKGIREKKEEDTGETGSGSTGIKLSLGGVRPSRSGSAVAESPGPGIFYGYGMTPGATPGASTPGPSGYNWGLERLQEGEVNGEVGGDQQNGEMLPPSLPITDFSSYAISYGTPQNFESEIAPPSTLSNEMDVDTANTLLNSMVDYNPFFPTPALPNSSLVYNPFFPPPSPSNNLPFQDTDILSAEVLADLGLAPLPSSSLPESSSNNQPTQLYDQASIDAEVLKQLESVLGVVPGGGGMIDESFDYNNDMNQELFGADDAEGEDEEVLENQITELQPLAETESSEVVEAPAEIVEVTEGDQGEGEVGEIVGEIVGEVPAELVAEVAGIEGIIN